MMYRTHMLGGLGAGLVVSQAVLGSMSAITNETALLTTMALIVYASGVGSMLPDIDHRNSNISQNFKISSFFIGMFAKHRGILHTPIFWSGLIGLIYLILSLIKVVPAPLQNNITLGLGAGVLSHLLLDTFTGRGIMWLYPFSKKYISIVGVKTGGIAEKVIRVLLTGGIVLLFI